MAHRNLRKRIAEWLLGQDDPTTAPYDRTSGPYGPAAAPSDPETAPHGPRAAFGDTMTLTGVDLGRLLDEGTLSLN